MSAPTVACVRICTGCLTEKPFDQFQLTRHGHPGSRCKRCRAQYCREYSIAHPRKTSGLNPLKRATEWAKRNPEKRAAHQAITHAVASGSIVPLPCEACGAEKTQAHHDDYSKKLEVRWLCVFCHRKEHRKYA